MSRTWLPSADPSNLKSNVLIFPFWSLGSEPRPVEISRQMIRRGQVFLTLKSDKLTAGPTVAPGMLDAKVPAEAQKEYQKGQAALEEKNSKKAIPHLEKAVNLYPAFYQAQFQTIEAFQKAIELKPKSATSHFNLGVVFVAIGQKAEAMEQYSALENLDPKLAKKLKEMIESRFKV